MRWRWGQQHAVAKTAGFELHRWIAARRSVSGMVPVSLLKRFCVYAGKSPQLLLGVWDGIKSKNGYERCFYEMVMIEDGGDVVQASEVCH